VAPLIEDQVKLVAFLQERRAKVLAISQVRHRALSLSSDPHSSLSTQRNVKGGMILNARTVEENCKWRGLTEEMRMLMPAFTASNLAKPPQDH
jgi:hypothetical protein